jgi:uncharacterized protein YecE (DUF72 family)
MTAVRKPQDRLQKTKPDHFSFTVKVDGKQVTHHLKPTEIVLSPGFMRATRRMDDVDAMFTFLEELATDDQLAIIDKMTRQEFNDTIAKPFMRHIKDDMGED